MNKGTGMNSFKLFVKSFGPKDHLRKLDTLTEMAKRSGNRLFIWDDKDKDYYKHIYLNTPEDIRKDKTAFRRLMQQAIYKRYGNQERSGLLHDNPESQADIQTITFTPGGGKISIKDVPVYPKQIIAKIEAQGWNWHMPEFGLSKGNWQPEQARAQNIIDYFTNDDEMSDKHQYYNPPSNAMHSQASEEEKSAHVASKEKGKPKTRNFEQFQEKSMEAIPLDEEDNKFLKSFEERFREKYGKEGVMVELELPQVLPYALAIRYSDHFIKMDGDTFVAKDEYKSKEHPDGDMFATIYIPWRKALINPKPEEAPPPARRPSAPKPYRPTPNSTKPGTPGLFDGIESYNPYLIACDIINENASGVAINVSKVYMNLPDLVKKFERFKKGRNFVKEPLMPHGGGDPKARSDGKQVATRWLKNKKFHPNWATNYGTMLKDNDFYKQISIDHDAWRKSGGEPVSGVPLVKNVKVEKLTWRDGDTIIQSPNIADAGVAYNADSMSWDDLIKHDAYKGVMLAIGILSGTKYKGDPNFRTNVNAPKSVDDIGNNEIGQAVLTDLMVSKTGVDPEEYRSQAQRIKFAKQAASRAIIDFFKQRGRGGEGGKDSDDMPSGIDSAAAREKGDTNNTGVATHRTDAPETSSSFAVGHDDDDTDYDYDLDPNEPQDFTAQRPQAPGTSPLMSFRKPGNVGMQAWMKMSPEQKLAAMRAAGLT